MSGSDGIIVEAQSEASDTAIKTTETPDDKGISEILRFEKMGGSLIGN